MSYGKKKRKLNLRQPKITLIGGSKQNEDRLKKGTQLQIIERIGLMEISKRKMSPA